MNLRFFSVHLMLLFSSGLIVSSVYAEDYVDSLYKDWSESYRQYVDRTVFARTQKKKADLELKKEKQLEIQSQLRNTISDLTRLKNDEINKDQKLQEAYQNKLRALSAERENLNRITKEYEELHKKFTIDQNRLIESFKKEGYTGEQALGRTEDILRHDVDKLYEYQTLFKVQNGKVNRLWEKAKELEKQAQSDIDSTKGFRENNKKSLQAAREKLAENQKSLNQAQLALNTFTGLEDDELVQAWEAQAKAVFDLQKERHYDAKFLLTDVDTLRAHGKLEEAQLRVLQAQVDARLGRTMLGQFVNAQIKAAFKSLCELQKSCAVGNQDAVNQKLGDTLRETSDHTPKNRTEKKSGGSVR